MAKDNHMVGRMPPKTRNLTADHQNPNPSFAEHYHAQIAREARATKITKWWGERSRKHGI
jgi:hypothetical protein